MGRTAGGLCERCIKQLDLKTSATPGIPDCEAAAGLRESMVRLFSHHASSIASPAATGTVPASATLAESRALPLPLPFPFSPLPLGEPPLSGFPSSFVGHSCRRWPISLQWWHSPVNGVPSRLVPFPRERHTPKNFHPGSLATPQLR